MLQLSISYTQADRQLKKHKNYQQLRYKEYYNRRIEGDRSEGSKAYLTCVNEWQLLEGTPAVQTCVRENGALVWTKAGTCMYCKSVCNLGNAQCRNKTPSLGGREGGREGGKESAY